MRVFSIDLETTGLDPAKHGVIEVGAIMFDLFDRNIPQKKFIRYISPEDMVWSQFCLKLHAAWLDNVNYRIQHGQFAEIPYNSDIMEATKWQPKICKNFAEMQLDFQQWLFVECGFAPPSEDGKWTDKIIPAGKNFSSFDRPFLLNNGFPVRMFHHRAIDPGPLYIRQSDTVPPEFKVCKERCPSFTDTTVAHTALEDAADVITLLHYYFDHDPNHYDYK